MRDPDPFLASVRENGFPFRWPVNPDPVTRLIGAVLFVQNDEWRTRLAASLFFLLWVRWSHFVGQFGSEVKVYSGV